MKVNWILATIGFCLLACYGSRVLAQQGYGDDADTFAVPKIWKEIPKNLRDENRVWQGVPSVEATSDNRVWVTWFSGGTMEPHADNVVLLATSANKGDDWSEPLFAVDPQDTTRASGPSLWYDPLKRLWILWHQSNIHVHDAHKKLVYEANGDEIRDCRGGVWCMISDNPEAGADASWSEPRRLCDGFCLNKPIVDSRGQWLFPVCVLRYNSRYPVDAKFLIGPNIFVSNDEGKTLSLLGHSKLDWKNSCWDEHNVVERSDGSLWLTARALYGFCEGFSTDGGKTWTDMKPSPTIKHTSSRFFMMKLQSGNLLLVKNGPVGADTGRNTITASLSKDDGKTWSESLVLDERKNVTYPNGAQGPDGTIYVVYDHGRHDEKEIVLARFTEEDLVAGEIVSPVGKTKIIVNQATGVL
ncbi:MAG: sialidase family protein [Planctomycetia bacterium]|nr:sialidase family protein [Planctomycetia bacterium]